MNLGSDESDGDDMSCEEEYAPRSDSDSDEECDDEIQNGDDSSSAPPAIFNSNDILNTILDSNESILNARLKTISPHSLKKSSAAIRHISEQDSSKNSIRKKWDMYVENLPEDFFTCDEALMKKN